MNSVVNAPFDVDLNLVRARYEGRDSREKKLGDVRTYRVYQLRLGDPVEYGPYRGSRTLLAELCLADGGTFAVPTHRCECWRKDIEGKAWVMGRFTLARKWVDLSERLPFDVPAEDNAGEGNS